MLYLSFPRNPNEFPRQLHWHAQISHHLYHGLRARFGSHNVEFVRWGKVAPVGHGDLVVTFLPNINYLHTCRIIGVENDTLIPERWTSTIFGRHGIDAQVDDIRHLAPILGNPVGYCVLSNDVAIAKLNAGDPSTCRHVEQWRGFVDGNYDVCTHPVDKRVFTRFPKGDFNRNNHRMLVYHRDWRKSSQATIDLLHSMGFREGSEFEIVEWVKKGKPLAMRRLARRFNIIFSGSFSETGPANILEFLTQGYLIAGHEDWWSGHGVRQTVWSYDPLRKQEMQENLSYLLDRRNVQELQDRRDNIHSRWLDREDNEWDHFCDRLARIIKNALAN